MRGGTLSSLDKINRTYGVSVLPDFRIRVVQRFDIVDGKATMGDGTKFDANVKLPWGSECPDYAGCRLVGQSVTGSQDNPNKSPNDPPAFLIRTWEQLPANDRIIVGEPGVSYNQYGFQEITLTYVQLSDGTTAYTDTVGTSTAPAPYAAAVLKTVEGSNDGTIRTYRLTYSTGGEMSDDFSLNFGGNLIIRTITSLNAIPATPAGYTLFGPGVEYINGLPLYRYRFSAVNGGGTPGTAAEIGRSYYNAQGGTVQFDPASPATADGTVKAVIEYITAQTVTTNPLPLPSGFVLVGLDSQQAEGYKKWTGTYERADGLVVDEKTISETGALVIYHRVAYGTAPTAPSATIGGTVTLFQNDTAQDDGYVRYERRWAEANGQSDYTAEGESDGAITYTVVTRGASAAVPAYPGSGTGYNIRLQQKTEGGYYTNIAVWRKPPASVTFKKKINFTKPGSAVIGGSPIQLTLSQQTTMTILADVLVDYGTTQITDVPFTVSEWATYYETYTPTDTGIAVSKTESLGGYLAGASGSSGTNSNFNGILCDSWSYQLGSSTPSSFSSGLKVLDTDNDPYLTDINGVVVYRRTKVSYTF